MDGITKDFLEKMWKEGLFDNSLLILMSDHGATFANRRALVVCLLVVVFS